MKDKIQKLIPVYGMKMLILVLLVNIITYCGTRLFTTGLYHHELSSFLDDRIPFLPGFITFYLLAYVQWTVGFILIARQEKNTCKKYMFGEIIAKLICMCCFVIYPTTIIRPEISDFDIFSRMTNWIYMVDAPDNLFPSIHCLESWVCLRTAFIFDKIPKWYKICSIIMTVGVFASTVCIKQHVVADMFGAVLAVEIGFGLMTMFLKKRKNVNE